MSGLCVLGRRAVRSQAPKVPKFGALGCRAFGKVLLQGIDSRANEKSKTFIGMGMWCQDVKVHGRAFHLNSWAVSWLPRW